MVALLTIRHPISELVDAAVEAWGDPIYRPLLIGVAGLGLILLTVGYVAFAAERRYKTVSIPDEGAVPTPRSNGSSESDRAAIPAAQEDAEDRLTAQRTARVLAEELRLLQIENARLQRRIEEAESRGS